MAREGIYIGGKEILERYVGDKLVWSKWKWRQIMEVTRSDKIETSTAESVRALYITRNFVVGSDTQIYTGKGNSGYVTFDGKVMQVQLLSGETGNRGRWASDQNVVRIQFVNPNDVWYIMDRRNSYTSFTITERYK